MVALTELDGVGPARSESLEAAGYENVADIAEAQPEQLAEDADIPEDTALGFVVQAENMTAAEDAEVEEDEPQPVTEEVEDAVGEASDEEESEESEEVEEAVDDAEVDESEPVEDSEPVEEEVVSSVEVEFDLDSGLEHDVFFAAVMRHKETMLQGNRTQTEMFDDLLNQLRSTSTDSSFTIETEPENLNELHNAARKLSVEYQGNNLIDHMNAMKEVQSQVNEYRQEFLF